MIRDELVRCNMSEKIHSSPIPSVPKPRRSIRSENTSRRRQTSNLSKNEELSSDGSEQMTEDSYEQDETDEEIQFSYSQNCSRTISPERTNVPLWQDSKYRPVSVSWRHCLISISVLSIFLLLFLYTNETQTQSINNNSHSSLFKFIEDVKVKFHNQESDIWNDISSAINEVISKTNKIPSIILLFANETTTMDCLATELAHVSSIILHTDSPKYLNPEDFGDDVGEIINTLKVKYPPVKVVIIRDILNINAKAIRALHVLCDRVTPLIEEAIYILTMRTNNYQSSEKKLSFVEEQIRRKLSKSIDQDILMALITRITDGAIISVQPEPHLGYCPS